MSDKELQFVDENSVVADVQEADRAIQIQAVGVQDEPVTEATQLVSLALKTGADIDKLEKVIALRNQELARMAKEEFEKHFAEMQRKLPVIKKGKEVNGKSGERLYQYAPIEELQSAAGPVISEHGFSYSWREEAIETGKRVVLMISGYGHTKETFFDVPPITGTQIQNAAQVAGALSSYGKRYTFMSGFGLTVENEDNDCRGLTFNDGVKYAGIIEQINACKTMDELKDVYKIAWESTDEQGRKALSIVKDRKKAELNATKN